MAEDAGFNLPAILTKILAAGIPAVPIIAGLVASIASEPKRKWTQEMIDARVDELIAIQDELIKHFVEDPE